MLRLVSLLGLACILLLAWSLSENRRKVPWRIVAWGLGLQFTIGVLVLNTGLRESLYPLINKGVDVLRAATLEGAKFVFGNLAVDGSINALMAFQVLPVIILVASLSAILYHLRIIQAVVYAIAVAMRYTLKTSGAETFTAALQIFFGIESIPAIRGYLQKMTRSELFVVMVTFMATIAGSVMVIYTTFGAEAGHLVTASLMSAPAAILIAKLMVPETAEPETGGTAFIQVPVESHNVLDAAARGASEGLSLAINIAGMLIAFIGLIYLVNAAFTATIGHSFTQVMGWVFQPVAFLLGVPRNDIVSVGELLGTKTVLNEFLAYMHMGDLVKSGTISPRAVTISTYALCGFANPGSLGILMAGLTTLVPERRAEIAALGLKSFVAGTLAAFATACVAGILVNA
jgi:CNT family concentrative nucleoside transporter